ncbi:molybdenum cofactor cytidylyltransferase [Ruegeria halocynthiae]|uniref:Molybdenum cofactor cytidylyltransferase n=1 Tax=Ruegeria halocynthiae TaxID=985054 RepID=A0A1H2TX70_9RHOB|nr:molybdopterin-binding protein [Ruegeria halocynthiae]SDW47744.1 molybdenum cofactor cytidylyltransferase [Ruegeria halocynthiae]
MKFGSVPLSDACGAILAHSVKAGDFKLRKGIALTSENIAHLQQAGLSEVTVARLEPGDCHEDEAAALLATALVPDPAQAKLRVTDAFTGRVNLLADGPGVAVLNPDALQNFNQINPMITVATVPQYQQMAAGGMVATIKVISYAVPRSEVLGAARLARGAIRLTTPRYRNAGLIVTEIAGGPSNKKGIAAIRGRVEALGMDLTDIQVVPHRMGDLSASLSSVRGEIVLILTGSATSDENDVAPASIRAAGGVVDRFGMPVDPGNLLFLGSLRDRPIIGLPGCARSPALNGADWVLSRVACGIETTGADIAAMGVGGLLKEIPTRPQPRAARVK